MVVVLEMSPVSTQDMEVDDKLNKWVCTSLAKLSTTTPEDMNSPEQKRNMDMTESDQGCGEI